MEEKNKKEISLLLILVTKKEESNLFFNCDSIFWKYEIQSLIGDNKYFEEGKKYYLGDNYKPSHTFGFLFNPFNRKVRKLLKEDYVIRLRLNSNHSLEFLIQNLEDLEKFYRDNNFFFQM